MFDHAQSPRLGQRVATDNTAVRMFSGQELPESPWHGMMIYRTDTQELQIYDAQANNGFGGWYDIVGGQVAQLTYVGDTIPVATSIGDQWYDTSTTPRQLYIAMSVGADQIAEGEWSAVADLTAINQRVDAVEQEVIAKPEIFFSDTMPTGTPERPLQENDIWYDPNNGHKQYKLQGGNWVSFDVSVADFSITARKFQTANHLIY